MKTRLFVIGGGPGGYVAALEASNLGASVTLIEKEFLGGTCLNWGCIPSKIMKHAADTMNRLKRASDIGFSGLENIQFDIKTLMQKKENTLLSQRKAVATLLEKRGISVIKGEASLISKNQLQVIDSEKNKKKYEFDKLIIAIGTKPIDLQTIPYDHTNILSSDDLLALGDLPQSIVIAGGGVIGCEFASIFSALGSKVTIVEGMSRLLPFPGMDSETSKVLLREMKKRKIRVLLDTIVSDVDIDSDSINVSLQLSPFTDNPKPKPLKQKTLNANKFAICIGRSSRVNQICPEKADIEITNTGWIKTNDFCQTNQNHIFAVGDILGPDKIMLAHSASHEGLVAARNAMGKCEKMKYTVVPSAIFTDPEIACVGLSSDQATQMGYDIKTSMVNYRNLGKAQTIGDIAGFAKLVADKKTNKILGVHLIGAHATELIAEATLAINNGLSIKDLADTIHPHPTLSEILGELGLKADNSPIHG